MNTNIARFLIIWVLTLFGVTLFDGVGVREPIIKATWIAFLILILSTLLFPTTRSWSVNGYYYEVKCRAVFFCKGEKFIELEDDVRDFLPRNKLSK